ncbi:MAG: endonuclease/exonuclease/phosphatase family protein [Bacteroidales bacterium]|nr:endonuclease/exonuclease/phosphatase family protein [Bacteroidales bacterium]
MGLKAVKLYFRSIVCAISMIILTLSVAAFFASKTEPEKTLTLQFLSLLIPIVIIINISLLIWWAVRKKIWLLIPLIGLFFNYKFITAIIGFLPGSSFSINDNSIVIATYNVNYFFYKEDSNLASIAKMVENYTTDILCLQEVQPHPLFSLDEIMSEFKSLPYSFIHIGDHNEIGMALFSKFPIIRAQKVKFPDSGNGFMWADILFKGDTIRVLNNHFQTTSLSKARGKRTATVIEAMGENYLKRAQQARFVRSFTDTTLYPIILCGDFNDTPHSYVYSTVKGDDLTDGFSIKGLGFGGTYRNKLGLVRIDYIMHSEHFRTTFYKSDPSKLSDHRAIFSVLEYQN